MIYKGKIASIDIAHSMTDNSDYLRVGLEIYEDDKLIETRYLGFPLGTDESEIKEEIKKYITTYENDKELSIKSLKVEELTSKSYEVAKKLQGKEIK